MSLDCFKGSLRLLCVCSLIFVLFMTLFINFHRDETIIQRDFSANAYKQIFSFLSTQFSASSCVTGKENDNKFSNESIPIIYAITPTYYRLTQRADMTRLSHTLRLVKKIHWIVIEDFEKINLNIQKLLNSSGISFTYFAEKKKETTKNYLKGADQRNSGLDWIMDNHDPDLPAVVYFVDDDNSYSLEIFEQLRYTKKISMWPVGLSGGRTYEAPVVKDGKIVKFIAWNAKGRKFPVDMAGFAINAHVLWKYHPMRFATNGEVGTLETKFLEKCCTVDEIEPMADQCTKVLVWHTKTSVPFVYKYGNLEV